MAIKTKIISSDAIEDLGTRRLANCFEQVDLSFQYLETNSTSVFYITSKNSNELYYLNNHSWTKFIDDLHNTGFYWYNRFYNINNKKKWLEVQADFGPEDGEFSIVRNVRFRGRCDIYREFIPNEVEVIKNPHDLRSYITTHNFNPAC